VPNLVAAGQTVWASVGSEKFQGPWAPAALGQTPRKTPLPTGVAAANLFLVGQTVWASVGGGVLKTSRNTSLHTGVIVILGQKVDA